MSLRRQLVVIVAVALVDAVLFGVSGIPRYRYASGDTTDGVIGEIVWIGFLVGAVALIAACVYAGVAARRRTAQRR